jgi:alkylation response protein AidB-like acyl-CoA dehydrogenase
MYFYSNPQFDHFHELIINQELGRIHARGYSDGLGGGTIIGIPRILHHMSHTDHLEGLPPIVNFARPALRDKIVPDCLLFRKFICLAVTEAFAGSDVAGIRCRAERVKDGWMVNGT